MADMTVGALSASHFGATFSITVEVGLGGPTETFTGEVTRVQHNAPTLDFDGQPKPAETLLSLESWSGTLDPTHPIELVEGGTNG